MEYLVGGVIVGLVYATWRLIKYIKAKKEIKEKLGKQIIDQVSFAFGGALFNAIMAGFSYAFIFAESTTPLLKGLYAIFGGVFIGSLFDVYRIKHVVFTKTAFYVEGINVRYKSVSKIYKKKRSKNYILETYQHHSFTFPASIINKIQQHRNKK